MDSSTYLTSTSTSVRDEPGLVTMRHNVTGHPYHEMDSSFTIYRAGKGVNPSLQMEELQETPVKSTGRMYICEVCDKSFSRKDNLSRHLLIHSEKKFQCHHCSKCYSQQGKLKIHQTRHHLDAKPISSKNSLVCANCSKMFGRSFNFKRHMAVCKKKSVEATKSDMEAMMLEMTQAERQYRQKLEVGETVSTLLNSNEHLSEESLSNEYKKALKMYRQSQVQHVPVYEHATLKPWQKEVLTFIQQPTHREVIWVVGQKGGEGKTFLQNYIKYNYSGRRVIVTDIATSTKDIAYFLSKFPLECKDIFLFNHPCSTTETIAYDMLEGIKDGHKVSAKYDTRGLFFKTPNTVIVFSNEFPMTGALKKDRWSIYEIIGEELYHKTPSTSKPSQLSSIPDKIQQPKYYHYYWYRVGFPFIWNIFNIFRLLVWFLCPASFVECPTSFVAQTSCHYQMAGSIGSWESLVGQRSCQANRWGGH